MRSKVSAFCFCFLGLVGCATRQPQIDQLIGGGATEGNTISSECAITGGGAIDGNTVTADAVITGGGAIDGNTMMAEDSLAPGCN